MFVLFSIAVRLFIQTFFHVLFAKKRNMSRMILLFIRCFIFTQLFACDSSSFISHKICRDKTGTGLISSMIYETLLLDSQSQTMPDKNLDFLYKNYLFQIKELLQFFIFVQICLFSGIKK
jgi:hypothetical protein